MSVIVSCPKCQKKLKIEDNVLGKNIKCPSCAAVFATKAPAGAAAPPPPPPPAKTAPAAPKKAPPPPDDDEEEAPRRPAKAAPKADLDDDEDDRPAKKPAAKKARDDDDDDEPPAKKSRADDDEDEDDRPAKKGAAKKGRASDDDDDDDDRPAKKEKKKGGSGKVLAIIGVIVLLLCGGCGSIGAYLWYKGSEIVGGAITNAQAQMTGPAFQIPTGQQGPDRGGLPGETPKSGPGTGKPDGGRGGNPSGEKPKVATDQQLADAMVADSVKAMQTYGFVLQLKGTVTRVNKGPDGKVNEIFYEPKVQGQPFPINCRLANAMPADLVPVGKGMVTVKGNLTGGGKTSATLNDCTLVFGP
jgi:hypothetical protein